MTAVLAFLTSLLQAIPILKGWFTTTPAEKAAKTDDEIEKEKKSFETTGRPK